jgi:hypothetical protein
MYSQNSSSSCFLEARRYWKGLLKVDMLDQSERWLCYCSSFSRSNLLCSPFLLQPFVLVLASLALTWHGAPTSCSSLCCSHVPWSCLASLTSSRAAVCIVSPLLNMGTPWLSIVNCSYNHTSRIWTYKNRPRDNKFNHAPLPTSICSTGRDAVSINLLYNVVVKN